MASAGLISKVRGAKAKERAAKQENGGFEDYEVDEAHRHLMNAHKVMKNKKLMAVVAKRAADSHKHIAKMAKKAAKGEPDQVGSAEEDMEQ